MVIGIAGKYCAGKDFIVGMVNKYRYNGLGFTVLDVDNIGHIVLEREKDRVVSVFGKTIVDKTGAIDRRKLGQIVFRNRENKAKLESILHPLMVDEVKKRIKDRKNNFIINAAILFDMGLHLLCDFVICINAPFFIRFRRALKRDNLPVWDIVKRLSAQRRICPKSVESEVDIYSVRNAGNAEDTLKAVSGILTRKGLIKG